MSGMGGIGKTELAIQYALRHQDDYPGGLCWLQCRGADLGTQIVTYSRSLLGLTMPDGLELSEQVAYCWQHWREGTVLVIYDDVADYNAIAPYLPPRNKEQFKVLMTSRQRAGINYKSIELDVLKKPTEPNKPDPALELIRAIVGVERIEAELENALALCEWLGRLPLGLEIVGRYLASDKSLTIETVQKRLEKKSLGAKALILNNKGDSTAQLGVAAAFDLSWDELSDKAKELGCRLSLFASAPIQWSWVEECMIKTEDEVEREEAQEELEELRNQELIDINLLQINEENEYRLHPLIREFFIIKQKEIENIDEYKRDLCRVMVAIAKQIPQAVILSVITLITPAIPHLKEVAEKLIDWVEDKDLGWPNEGLARIYQEQSAYSEAEKYYKQSVKVTQSRLRDNHPDIAASYNNLALLYSLIGRYAEAEPLHQKALEIRLEQLGESHSDVAASYNNLALLYYVMGRYAEAEPLHQKALEISIEQLGDNHPDVAASYNNLALLYYAMGRYTAAEPLYGKALEISIKQLGDNHPHVAVSYNNLANVYQAMGRYTAAEPMYGKALEISIKQLGDNHPNVAQFYNNLAYLYSLMGWYEEAEPMYGKALEIRLEQLGSNHPDVAQSYNNLAVLYSSMGRYTEAEPMYRKALEIRLKQLGANHPNVATSYNNLAALYQSMGRYEDAIAHYQKSLNIAMQALGEDHPNTRTIQENYMTMLLESPEEEILKALPEEMHESYRQMRRDWENSLK